MRFDYDSLKIPMLGGVTIFIIVAVMLLSSNDDKVSESSEISRENIIDSEFSFRTPTSVPYDQNKKELDGLLNPSGGMSLSLKGNAIGSNKQIGLGNDRNPPMDDDIYIKEEDKAFSNEEYSNDYPINVITSDSDKNYVDNYIDDLSNSSNVPRTTETAENSADDDVDILTVVIADSNIDNEFVDEDDSVTVIEEGSDSSSGSSSSSSNSGVDSSFLIFSNYSSGTYNTSLNVDLYSARENSSITYCVGSWFSGGCSCTVLDSGIPYVSSIPIGGVDGLHCVSYSATDINSKVSLEDVLIFNVDSSKTMTTFSNTNTSHYVQSDSWIEINNTSAASVVSTGDKEIYDCADPVLNGGGTTINLESSKLDPSKLIHGNVKNIVYDGAGGDTCPSMSIIVKDFEIHSVTTHSRVPSNVVGTQMTGGFSSYGSFAGGRSGVDGGSDTKMVSGFQNIVGQY